MMASAGQKAQGNVTKPRLCAKGDVGSQIPIVQMASVVRIKGQLARLWMNGILFVRMMWMISVCVTIDSTNHAVWNMGDVTRVLA